MAGNEKSGRKPKLNAKRTGVLLDNEVLEYLGRSGNVSAEIERIARKEMGQASDQQPEQAQQKQEITFEFTVEQLDFAEADQLLDMIDAWVEAHHTFKGGGWAPAGAVKDGTQEDA